jgi:Fe-S cluster biogenesis protein NfuA
LRVGIDGAVLVGHTVDTAFSDPQQPADEQHRGDDEQDLVPAALVGEDRTDREHRRRRYGRPVSLGPTAGIIGRVRWLNEGISTSPPTTNGATLGMREQVEKTVEVIRPALRADGGDIILHDVDEESGVITVELIGACVGCPASTQTLKAGIERIMRDRIDGVTEVVNVE